MRCVLRELSWGLHCKYLTFADWKKKRAIKKRKLEREISMKSVAYEKCCKWNDPAILLLWRYISGYQQGFRTPAVKKLGLRRVEVVSATLDHILTSLNLPSQIKITISSRFYDLSAFGSLFPHGQPQTLIAAISARILLFITEPCVVTMKRGSCHP